MERDRPERAARALLALARFRRADDGQDLLEYGFLGALIAVFALGAVTFLSQQIDQVLWQVIAGSY